MYNESNIDRLIQTKITQVIRDIEKYEKISTSPNVDQRCDKNRRTSESYIKLANTTDLFHRDLAFKHTLPQIERLFKPITNQYEESENLYPSSYGGPPGPKCNWRKCSKLGGCGTECVCHPAGRYGWRCIPKCCIRADGYPPCRFIYGYDVICTLPCSSWPGLCSQHNWNPYKQYQVPYE